MERTKTMRWAIQLEKEKELEWKQTIWIKANKLKSSQVPRSQHVPMTCWGCALCSTSVMARFSWALVWDESSPSPVDAVALLLCPNHKTFDFLSAVSHRISPYLILNEENGRSMGWTFDCRWYQPRSPHLNHVVMFQHTSMKSPMFLLAFWIVLVAMKNIRDAGGTVDAVFGHWFWSLGFCRAAGGRLGWMPMSARHALTSFVLNSPWVQRLSQRVVFPGHQATNLMRPHTHDASVHRDGICSHQPLSPQQATRRVRRRQKWITEETKLSDPNAIFPVQLWSPEGSPLKKLWHFQGNGA